MLLAGPSWGQLVKPVFHFYMFQKAVFVTGPSNFKLESVISHETSEQHLRSVGKQSAKENLTVNSAAAKIVQSLNKNVFNRMTLHKQFLLQLQQCQYIHHKLQ
jgi:hypothetical protein